MPGFASANDYARAREVLRNALYSTDSVHELLNVSAQKASQKLPEWLKRTSELNVRNTVVRLFYLSVAVPIEAARRALLPMSLEDWISAGLLKYAADKESVEATVSLWPGKSHVLASDMMMMDESTPADIVVQPGPISLLLSHAMIDSPVSTTLDLGSGCGNLAMMAAEFSDQVVAVDCNRRAIEFTNFNARLNGINNVVAIEGNLFEPVRDRRFGLVVSNPPFVISPTSKFVYRDSGSRGDLFCRQLIRDAPAILADGGFFQLSCNLPHEAGRPWKDSLAEWFEGLGCDVVVWGIITLSASEYAMSWIVGTETSEPEDVQRHFDEWMAYYEQERIEAVSTLIVTLRNSRSDNPWLHIDDPPCHLIGPSGVEFRRCFATFDRFPDDALADVLNHRCRLAPDVRIQQELAMGDDGLRIAGVRLLKTGGLQYQLKVSENLAGLLAVCDGLRTMGQLIHTMAENLGVDQDRMTEKLLPMIRSFLVRSVLVIEEG